MSDETESADDGVSCVPVDSVGQSVQAVQSVCKNHVAHKSHMEHDRRDLDRRDCMDQSHTTQEHTTQEHTDHKDPVDRRDHQDPVDHQGHEEPSDGESSSTESVPAHSAHAYSSTRRTPRRHKRVVRQGTELFDADGVKLEPSDMQSERQRAADDDRRILNELPPHWAVFEERS